MPAKQRYPSPAAQMVTLARIAKGRGLDFEEWWEEAVRPHEPAVTPTTPTEKIPEYAVLWPSDSYDGRIWRLSTADAKEGWRRAYEGAEASSAEKAIKILAPLLGLGDAVDPRSLIAA